MSNKASDVELQKIAKRVMCRMRGWNSKQFEEDRTDHYRQHNADMVWLKRQLRGVTLALVMVELKGKKR